MVHFPKQELLPSLGPLAFRDVTGDFRGADDFAFLVFDRRNGEGNVNETPVLALPNRLVMIDTLALADPLEEWPLFVLSIHWNKDRHRPSHRLLRRIAKEELRATVPSHNDAVEILGKDRVVRQFDDSRVVLRGAFAAQPLWESDRPRCSRDNLQLCRMDRYVPDARVVTPMLYGRRLYGSGSRRVHIDAALVGRYRALDRSSWRANTSSRADTGLLRKILPGTRRLSLFGFPDA